MIRWLNDLITERGSAAILRERIGLLITERDVALRKLAESQAAVARLEVDKGNIQAKADKLKAEVKMLRDFLPDYLGETDPGLRARLRGDV